MVGYVLVLLVVLAIALGQLLFKFVALRVPPGGELTGIFSDQAALVAMAAALALYAGATGLWIHVLRSLPLSAAYPFVALTFFIVPVGAALLFGEKLSAYNMLGGVLILTGIYFCVKVP
jgi:drug/metabolite transporter (DMT)-like permease